MDTTPSIVYRHADLNQAQIDISSLEIELSSKQVIDIQIGTSNKAIIGCALSGDGRLFITEYNGKLTKYTEDDHHVCDIFGPAKPSVRNVAVIDVDRIAVTYKDKVLIILVSTKEEDQKESPTWRRMLWSILPKRVT